MLNTIKKSWGGFFNMTSFGGDHLNIYLHNIIMQYLFGS